MGQIFIEDDTAWHPEVRPAAVLILHMRRDDDVRHRKIAGRIGPQFPQMLEVLPVERRLLLLVLRDLALEHHRIIGAAAKRDE